MMKRFVSHILVLALFFAGIRTASAQSIDQVFNEDILQHRVEMLDIFFERFNLEKDIEGNSLQGVRDPGLHRSYLLSLFDQDYLIDTLDVQRQDEVQTLVMSFLDAVTASRKPVTLAYSDSTWCAQVLCRCTYNKKECDVTLFLKPELVRPGEFKWVIFDADAEFLHLTPDTLFVRGISPVEHEMKFLGLREITDSHNNKSVVAYADKSYRVNPLTVFFTMIYDSKLTFNHVLNVQYHFFTVPGYHFTVQFRERPGYNAGWLITDLQKYEL